MKKDGIIVHIKRSAFVNNAKSGSMVKHGQQHFTIHIHHWGYGFIIVLLFFILCPGCSMVETLLEVNVSYYYRFTNLSDLFWEKLSFPSISTTFIWSSVREIVERDEISYQSWTER